LGKKWNVHDLACELVKDRAYFEPSFGGVTLSGGEAALQNDFCLFLLKELKERGFRQRSIPAGRCLRQCLQAFLPYVDILLYDNKRN